MPTTNRSDFLPFSIYIHIYHLLSYREENIEVLDNWTDRWFSGVFGVEKGFFSSKQVKIHGNPLDVVRWGFGGCEDCRDCSDCSLPLWAYYFGQKPETYGYLERKL